MFFIGIRQLQTSHNPFPADFQILCGDAAEKNLFSLYNFKPNINCLLVSLLHHLAGQPAYSNVHFPISLHLRQVSPQITIQTPVRKLSRREGGWGSTFQVVTFAFSPLGAGTLIQLSESPCLRSLAGRRRRPACSDHTRTN